MFKKTGTVVGTPGASARKSASPLNKAFSKLTWKGKIVLAILGTAIGFMTALATGLNPLSGIALLASFILFMAGVATAPAIWGVVGVVAAYITIAVPMAGYIISNAAGYLVDVEFAIRGGIGLVTAALLAAWFSMRFSRQAAWKSLSYALGLSTIGGLVGSYFIPQWGLNIPLTVMASVVLYNSGLGDIIKGAFSWIQEKLSGKSHGMDNIVEIDGAVLQAKAEQKTAKALEGTTAKTIVFHDVTADRANVAPHVVISTTGLALLASFTLDGPVRETKNNGLIIPGVDLSNVVKVLIETRNGISKKLKVRADAVRIVLVVHGDGAATVSQLNKSFAVYSQANSEKKIANVHVVSSDELLNLVDTGLDMWNPLTMRAVVRRARLGFKPAHLTKLNESEGHEGSVILASIDSDGREMTVPNSVKEAEQYAWILPGTPVIVQTSKGKIGDVVVAGDVTRSHETQELIAPVCAVEEWLAAEEEGRNPETYWMNANKLIRDNTVGL